MSDEALLRTYLRQIQGVLRAGTATEHTYRPYLKDLLEALAPGLTATNEPKRRTDCGAPDYVITRTVGSLPLTLGYIEAKDVGVPLAATEASEQLRRYRNALPNLILTDYLEFRWYVNGAHRMTARLATVGAGHALVWDSTGAEHVAELLGAFLASSPEPISSPKELAERMARMAHMVHDLTLRTFETEKSGDAETQRDLQPALRMLHGLHQAFSTVLLPDLSEEQFADMFAQTLAYGLFAARYNHRGSRPFRRQDAAREIPKTNPFLKQLFETMTGSALDDAPFVGFVDDLAQLLSYSDLAAVLAAFGKRTRTDDPIVHFYETFLAAYDSRLREVRGVYYTPEPVVSYIVRSVDHLLKTDFACADGLAETSTVVRQVGEGAEQHAETSPRVLVLDPATGTGTFLYAVIDHIRERFRARGSAGMWPGYVHSHLLPRIFGFELLVAPYAMAHLKLGMQLAALDLPEAERAQWAYDFSAHRERLGVYLTNTLEEAAKRTSVTFAEYISDEANEAAGVKLGKPVMVVLGNPPYSGHSANKGEWISKLLRGTDTLTGVPTGSYFVVDGKALGERNPKWLNDDYVKFIRFAQWRIERTGYGVLAFITNHGYLDNPTFRGMRQSLMQTFDDIYVLDLHGNSKKKERAPGGGRDENVFDIQQGVAIGVFVKREHQTTSAPKPPARVRHAHLWGGREAKYEWLAEQSVTTTEWTAVEPRTPFYFFVPQDTNLLAEYEQGYALTSMMGVNVLGFQTHRDHFAIDMDEGALKKRIMGMRDARLSNSEYAEKYELKDNRDWQLAKARNAIMQDARWEQNLVRCLYRPFDWRPCYFDSVAMDYPRRELLDHVAGRDNLCLLSSRQQATLGYRHSWVADAVANDCVISTTSREANQVFPLYLYPAPTEGLWHDGVMHAAEQKRRANLAPAFVEECARRWGLGWVEDGRGDRERTFGPEDVFAYLYAVLNAPSYRERYNGFLKSDFPRVPLTADPALFRELCALGDDLISLHLLKRYVDEITSYPLAGSNVVDGPRYTAPLPDGTPGRVWINATQYFEGITPEVWEFHIGGYQVCEKWLKDRKGRTLDYADLEHYQQTVAALAETRRLMDEIDEAIAEHGGWPLGGERP